MKKEFFLGKTIDACFVKIYVPVNSNRSSLLRCLPVCVLYIFFFQIKKWIKFSLILRKPAHGLQGGFYHVWYVTHLCMVHGVMIIQIHV